MGFVKLEKPTGIQVGEPQVSIGPQAGGKSTYIALNKAARAALGDPVAVFLEHDADRALMRLVASSPDDPAAYVIQPRTGRIAVTRIARKLGFGPTRAVVLPVVHKARLSLIVNVKDIPRA